jgi:hypothetical protein
MRVEIGMNSESSSMFPNNWTPQLQRREPAECAHVLRDEVRDLYAALPEVRFVVVQQSGDCFSNCDVWLYFEMCGWDDELMEDLIFREFVLKELNMDSDTCFSFHYMPLVLPEIDPPLKDCCQ